MTPKLLSTIQDQATALRFLECEISRAEAQLQSARARDDLDWSITFADEIRALRSDITEIQDFLLACGRASLLEAARSPGLEREVVKASLVELAEWTS